MSKTKSLSITIFTITFVVCFLLSACETHQPANQATTTADTRTDVVEDSSSQPWVKKADMPTARTCNAIIINDKAYTLAPDDQSHICIEEYDISTDLWVKRNSVSKLTHKGAYGIASLNGEIYIAGGYDKGPLSQVEKYNTEDDSWTIVKDMPEPLDCTSAISSNGKLYVMGGMDIINKVTGIVLEYDPANDSWSVKASMPTPRSEIGIAEVNGKIYAMGGNWGRGLEVEEYDPGNNTWQKKADLQIISVAYQPTVLSGKIYIFFKGTIQQYDPSTNECITLGKMPEEKLWFNGTAAYNDKIYIFGGLKGEMNQFQNAERLKTVWEYDPTQESSQSQNSSTYLKKITDRYAAENKLNGSIIVARDGKILLSEGYGKADAAENIPITTDTRFCLASVTKQFTAMAIMQLEEKGLLSVKDPLTKYFKGYDKWKDISIHHLLNHTSGITRDVQFIFDAKERSPKILEAIKDTPLEFEPGTSFSYCNTGYNILGFIIEKVTGQSYEKYMYENIFRPLGMSNTGAAVTPVSRTTCAKGYTFDQGTLLRQDIPDLYKLVGCCNIYSSAEDMYKWGYALYTEKLVKKETLEKIFTPELDDYANGWSMSHINGRRVAIHGGGCEGVHCQMIRYMDENLVLVLLTNVSNTDSDSIITVLDSALHD